MKKHLIILFSIFSIAILIRFLYFPNNIYFGFDQARDAFESTNIYKNLDLKIIGPSTSRHGLFHGPAWWYLVGPFYFFSSGNPEVAAAFVLFINALGVFLVYKISSVIFNSKVGLISSLLFAFSFEQTQYALYFGNPAPAVLTIMLFYLGLSITIFKNKWYGLPISLFGLGLSIQFQFALIYLSLIFIIIFLIYKREIVKHLNIRTILFSVSSLFVSLSTFVVAEILYGFKTLKILFGLEGKSEAGEFSISNFSLYFQKISTLFGHNFLNIDMGLALVAIFIFLVIGFKYADRDTKKKLTFLTIWGFSSSILFLFGKPNMYYFNIGVFIGLLIFGSYLLFKVFEKNILVFIVLLLLFISNNLLLIVKNNPTGITNDIYVQEGMILAREKELIDYIYNNSNGLPIVVSATTMPLKINTTWAYLFNWYGQKKYGTIPNWAGGTALGFPGDLPAWKSQEEDYAFYSIIEPKRGVGQGHIDSFLSEQAQYGEIVEEKTWGNNEYNMLVVQKRQSKKNEKK